MSDYPESGHATMQDVETICGLGRDQTRAAVLRGELPAKKIGGKYVARWEWINAWRRGEPGFWDQHASTEPTPFRTPGPRALDRKAG